MFLCLHSFIIVISCWMDVMSSPEQTDTLLQLTETNTLAQMQLIHILMQCSQVLDNYHYHLRCSHVFDHHHLQVVTYQGPAWQSWSLPVETSWCYEPDGKKTRLLIIQPFTFGLFNTLFFTQCLFFVFCVNVRDITKHWRRGLHAGSCTYCIHTWACSLEPQMIRGSLQQPH